VTLESQGDAASSAETGLGMTTRGRVRLACLLTLLASSACRSGSPSAPPAPSAPADPSACVAAIADHQRTVAAHLDAARAKTSARDGAGCLAELDAYDRDAWSPTPSTIPTSAMAMSRAMCMMLAGDCSHGKELYRSSLATNAGATLGPEMLARSVDAIAALYCQGGALEPRDELLKAVMDLDKGAYMTTSTPAACQAESDAIKRLLPLVKPQSADDSQIVQAPAILRVAGPECLARAGDCDGSWRVFHDAWLEYHPYDEATLRTMFGSVVRRCADR
jgi:hypothetical protein